jgi:hypothetical protein
VSSLNWDYIGFVQRVIRLPAANTKAGRKLDLPMTDVVYDLLASRRAMGHDSPYVVPADSRSEHIEQPAHPLALSALVNHSLRRDVTSGYVVMTDERLGEPSQRICDRLKALCEIATDQIEGLGRMVARLADRRKIVS